MKSFNANYITMNNFICTLVALTCGGKVALQRHSEAPTLSALFISPNTSCVRKLMWLSFLIHHPSPFNCTSSTPRPPPVRRLYPHENDLIFYVTVSELSTAFSRRRNRLAGRSTIGWQASAPTFRPRDIRV